MMLPSPRGKGTIRGSPFSSTWQSSLALSAGFWLIYTQCGKDAPCCPLQPRFHMLEIHQVTDFIFLGSKLTEDSDCSHEIKGACSLEENYAKSRQFVKKQRCHFADKGPSSQSYGLSSGHVRMWELDHNEGWAPKNWCFWTVVLEKTLESPLDCKEIQPVTPKGISPEYSLEGLLKLKLQYFGHLVQTANTLEKTLMLGKTEGKRRRGEERMRQLDGIINSMDMSLSKLREIWRTGKPGVLQFMGCKESDMTELLNNDKRL